MNLCKDIKKPGMLKKEDVKWCRLMDCYEASKRRVIFCHGSTEKGITAMDVLIKYLMAEGGAKELEGVAPKGGLARQIQNLLKEAEKAGSKR